MKEQTFRSGDRVWYEYNSGKQPIRALALVKIVHLHTATIAVYDKQRDCVTTLRVSMAKLIRRDHPSYADAKLRDASGGDA